MFLLRYGLSGLYEVNIFILVHECSEPYIFASQYVTGASGVSSDLAYLGSGNGWEKVKVHPDVGPT